MKKILKDEQPFPAPLAAPASLPKKWRKHHQILLKLREQLLRQRTQLIADIASGAAERGQDSIDTGLMESDQDLAVTQLSVEDVTLRDVDDALERMLAGSYGICESSGRPIEPERLKAIPWTKWSREAAEKSEALRSSLSKRKEPDPPSHPR